VEEVVVVEIVGEEEAVIIAVIVKLIKEGAETIVVEVVAVVGVVIFVVEERVVLAWDVASVRLKGLIGKDFEETPKASIRRRHGDFKEELEAPKGERWEG